MSTIEDNLWVDNYKKGRDLFRKYSIMKYSHLFSSQKYGKIIIDIDEDITIDYLYLHNNFPTTNSKLNIIISGTHGVEGYAGTAIQCKTLDNFIQKKQLYREEDMSYLFIHALNPYGYQHNRRCTKQNIDLNRNYLDFFPKTIYPDQIFELIITYLFSFKFIFLFFSILFQYGYTKSREYIVKGQYNHSQGLFYGGTRKQQNIRELEHMLDTIDLSSFTDIHIFDIHTGLGKYGNLSVMVPNHTYEELTKFIKCNETTNLVNISVSNMYQDSKGSITEGMEDYFKHRSFKGTLYPIILEYGTYSNIQIFIGLLMENYYYINSNNSNSNNNNSNNSNSNEKELCKSQNKLRDLFYINEPEWKQMILSNYQDIISQFN